MRWVTVIQQISVCISDSRWSDDLRELCAADLEAPPASRKQHISVSQLTRGFVISAS